MDSFVNVIDTTRAISSNSYFGNLKKGLHIVRQPHKFFLKLNIDGSHRASDRSAACGGKIRDSACCFIKEFHCSLGTSTQGRIQDLVFGPMKFKTMYYFIQINSFNNSFIWTSFLNRSLFVTLIRTKWDVNFL